MALHSFHLVVTQKQLKKVMQMLKQILLETRTDRNLMSQHH